MAEETVYAPTTRIRQAGSTIPEIGEAAARQIVIRDGNIVQDWRG